MIFMLAFSKWDFLLQFLSSQPLYILDAGGQMSYLLSMQSEFSDWMNFGAFSPE